MVVKQLKPKRDSLDKIIGTYFACVTDEPFTYKNKEYLPRPICISPGIFRGYVCHAKCGACCFRFSLDYLPSEQHPYQLDEREVSFNGKQVLILSDLQLQDDTHYCANLKIEDGLCGIHGSHPFSCDFEILRFLQFAEHPNRVTTKLYGRGWNMLRIDGERGAMCTMEPVTESSRDDVLRKLRRLEQWTDYFGLKTKLPRIIDYCTHIGLEHHTSFYVGNAGEGLEND